MIHSPVLIIGCPRSGTTLLYNILSEIPEFWSIGYESKAIIEKHHHPSTKAWVSGELDASDITPESRSYMLNEFEHQAAPGKFWQRVNRLRYWLRDNSGWQAVKRHGRTRKTGSSASSAAPQQGLNVVRKIVRLRNTVTSRPSNGIRLLEKTPENCLRLPFLLELFPDARLIYLVRDGRANVNSLMEGWRHPHAFPGYQVPGGVAIPGYTRGRWAFTLIPGWDALRECSLEEVCAWQWIQCNQSVLDHQSQTQGRVPYFQVYYEDLTSNPGKILPHMCDFLEIPFNGVISHYAESLPQINVVSAPDPEKWRTQNGETIERILPILQPMLAQLNYI
jgi:hypothetical protein